MAVPSSGQLTLRGDIALEIDGSATGSDVSLNTLSSEAGFSAPNGMQEFYGYVDAVLPSVSTQSSISVGTSSMTVRGNVSSDGGGTITERGFYFGTSTNATSNTKYTVSGTTGAFTRSMTGLSSGTTYRVFAFATNSVGTTIGNMVTTGTASPSLGMSLSVSHTSPAANSCVYNVQITGGIYGTYSGLVATCSQNMYNSLTGNCTSSCGANTRYPSSGSINNSKQWHATSVSGAGFIIWSTWSASGYATTSYTHGSYYGPGNGGC